MKGCADPEVSGIGGWCYDFLESACTLPVEVGAYEDENKQKVCGQNAEQFPVEVSLTKPASITESKLKNLMDLDCLIKMGSGVNSWDQFWNRIWSGITFHAGTSNVWVSENLIRDYKGRKKECLGFKDSYGEVDIKSGKLYIESDLDNRLGVVHKLTLLFSKPTYYKLEKGFSYDISFEDTKPFYRINASGSNYIFKIDIDCEKTLYYPQKDVPKWKCTGKYYVNVNVSKKIESSPSYIKFTKPGETHIIGPFNLTLISIKNPDIDSSTGIVTGTAEFEVSLA